MDVTAFRFVNHMMQFAIIIYIVEMVIVLDDLVTTPGTVLVAI
jgi:hypothetical protein